MSVEAGDPFGDDPFADTAPRPDDTLRCAGQVARARRPDGEAMARMRARAVGLGPLGGGGGPGGAPRGGVGSGASSGAATIGARGRLALGVLTTVALGGVSWWLSAPTGDAVTTATGRSHSEDVAPDIAPADEDAARSSALSGDIAVPAVAPADLTTRTIPPTHSAATPTAPVPRAVLDHDLVADTAEAELALIRAAQSSIDARPELALRFSERHRARFPSGLLAEERETLAIDALVRLGRAQAAQTRAHAMRQRWPLSAHWTRLERRFAEAGLTLPP